MSRRAQKMIVLLCSTIVFLVIAADRYLHRDGQAQVSESNSSPPAAAATGDDWGKYHNKVFTVIKVVDGDTLDIDSPDGKYKTTRIRLLGVDTPETKKPNTEVMYFGPEAYDFTKRTAMGKNVTVLLDQVSGSRDRYGRLLGYVKFADGQILNEMLITQGYAYADSRFKHSFYNSYMQLQNAARRAKRGLWKDVRLEQMPNWMQKKEVAKSKKAA